MQSDMSGAPTPDPGRRESDPGHREAEPGRCESEPGRRELVARPGDWVRVAALVLRSGERAPGVPDDTAALPLVAWMKGRLLRRRAAACEEAGVAEAADAGGTGGAVSGGEAGDGGGIALGDEAEIITAAGRTVVGTVVEVHPAWRHGFGRLVPELIAVGERFRSALHGGRAGAPGEAQEPPAEAPPEATAVDAPLPVSGAGRPAPLTDLPPYSEITANKNAIMKRAVGIDYDRYEYGRIEFDYEAMMAEAGADLETVTRIQREAGVGGTPLLELRNLTELARRSARPGKGARILLKDEAANPSGSFKARRASLAVHRAAEAGFKGVVAATSGNYGAAVASQAAMRGLGCIVVQECFDSRGAGQPEIIEKARACEAYGAEVIQLTVGPELFYLFLCVLEETGWFNASLYTPYGIAGVETLGAEIARQTLSEYGRYPDLVVATHAGGGNVTGTARGLRKAGAGQTAIVGASVNLEGLHMASDRHFNRKSFTTGHTGFGVPFAVAPDRSDVPRSAARPLRYLDRDVTVRQGEVFAVTEALARLEGLERGPAGNTSLAAALSLAQELDRDQIVVVQESEYTGAGKHVQAQLSFARENGIAVRQGDPSEEIPGQSIVLPDSPDLVAARDVDLDRLRRSRIRHAVAGVEDWVGGVLSGRAGYEGAYRSLLAFLGAEVNRDDEFVAAVLREVVTDAKPGAEKGKHDE